MVNSENVFVEAQYKNCIISLKIHIPLFKDILLLKF